MGKRNLRTLPTHEPRLDPRLCSIGSTTQINQHLSWLRALQMLRAHLGSGKEEVEDVAHARAQIEPQIVQHWFYNSDKPASELVESFADVESSPWLWGREI